MVRVYFDTNVYDWIDKGQVPAEEVEALQAAAPGRPFRKDVSGNPGRAPGQNGVEKVGPGGNAGREAGKPPRLRLAGRPCGSRKVSSPPRDQARIRQLMNESFLKSRPEADAALQLCFSSPKTVLACVELLARLNGELP